jgi:flagellar basal-body rod protein FlgB
VNWLDSVPIDLLNKDLDGLWARQQVISDNIANSETPDYKSKTVYFEDQLLEALSSGHTLDQVENVNNVEIITSVSDDETLRADGTNVDIESENTELARTQLNYLYSLQELGDQLARIRCAITGN